MEDPSNSSPVLPRDKSERLSALLLPSSSFPSSPFSSQPSRGVGVGGFSPFLRALLFSIACFSVFVCGVLSALFFNLVLLSGSSRDSGAAVSSSASWGSARVQTSLGKPVVILISMDGFRWGYNLKVPTPNIDRLRANGTEAGSGLMPVFPSVTFPNHYSIATGLYPAWHGIIANSFTDPTEPALDGNKFYMGNYDPKWWLGEPMWETAVKNGLVAATYFWPGSDVTKGPWVCSLPYCHHYNGSVPYEERVDTILDYFDLPLTEIPSFITLYLEEPDHTGHITGPDDPLVDSAITYVDETLGRLLSGLDKKGISEDVTIILLGDHGMVTTCDKKIIYLEDLKPWIEIPSSWRDSTTPILAIRPPIGVNPEEVVKNITLGLESGIVENGEYLKVYLKEDLPSRFHYSDSVRIQPIIGIAAEGYKVESLRSNAKECGGAHGYDNSHLSMRTVFIGHGPPFARGRTVPSFKNIEVYNIIASILGIEGAANNGTLSFPNSVLLPAKKL